MSIIYFVHLPRFILVQSQDRDPSAYILALALITLFLCFLSVLHDTARFICASLDTFKLIKRLLLVNYK